VPIRALLLLVLVTGCHRRTAPTPPRPDAAPAAIEHREQGLRFWSLPDEAAALREVLRGGPRIVGFGEYHQKKGSAKAASAIQRFAGPLLRSLAPSASDLILETWVTDGRCGDEEREVARQVEVTTQRPAETENEVLRLARQAKALGVQPHALTVSCKEYKRLLGGGEEVDYEKLLVLITRQLEGETRRVWAAQTRALAAAKKPAPPPRAIVLYGGALHNDRFPPVDELRAFSYAPALDTLSAGHYVEVDLYVPEYIAGDADLAKQAWWPIFRRHASRSRLLLIERGERSYILIFRKS
jgi:hypothetical protein